MENLEQEIERYKETNRRLNRRCSNLEKRIAKYRRRYVSIQNPIKSIEYRMERLVGKFKEIDEVYTKQSQFGWFHWFHVKNTLANINRTISLFFQRLSYFINSGYFHPEEYYKNKKRLEELEKKFKNG